jgi:FixJ family two-component response regulator
MDLIKMPRKRCVHIVDDEATVRDSLAVLLSTAGIKSRAYASAEEYLASVPFSEPGCIILDNQLPGLSGMELLKRLADAASNTAVILITGYADVPTAVSAMKIGAFHFVPKPFDAEALLIIVEEALARADEVRDLQIQGAVRAAHATRAGGPDLADRRIPDQAHCPPFRDQREDDRASQGRGHAKDAGAHYFPPCADGTQSWALQRRQ